MNRVTNTPRVRGVFRHADPSVAWHGRPPRGAPQPGSRHPAARRGLDGRHQARHEREGRVALALHGRAQANGRWCATPCDSHHRAARRTLTNPPAIPGVRALASECILELERSAPTSVEKLGGLKHIANGPSLAEAEAGRAGGRPEFDLALKGFGQSLPAAVFRHRRPGTLPIPRQARFSTVCGSWRSPASSARGSSIRPRASSPLSCTQPATHRARSAS